MNPQTHSTDDKIKFCWRKKMQIHLRVAVRMRQLHASHHRLSFKQTKYTWLCWMWDTTCCWQCTLTSVWRMKCLALKLSHCMCGTTQKLINAIVGWNNVVNLWHMSRTEALNRINGTNERKNVVWVVCWKNHRMTGDIPRQMTVTTKQEWYENATQKYSTLTFDHWLWIRSASEICSKVDVLIIQWCLLLAG